jgi:2-methylisocitrate lyase-like PEP mutase family enzyme
MVQKPTQTVICLSCILLGEEDFHSLETGRSQLGPGPALSPPKAHRLIEPFANAADSRYPDGNKMQPRLLAHLAGEIVKTVKVPVSIDFEAGYSDKPVVVMEYLKPIVAAGISGINIEDGIDESALLAKKIEAIKKMLSSEGGDVFVNARTDVYLRDLVADDKKVPETLDRAATYQGAGADGPFVPGLTEIAHIAKLTHWASDTPSVEVLFECVIPTVPPYLIGIYTI